MAADLSGCRARLEWASEALQSFYVEIGLWLAEHEPSQTTVEYHPEANVHTFRLVTEPIPQRFGVIAGNIVHQIRASLDNLVWQLVIANECKPRGGAGGNSFPILTWMDSDKTFANLTANTLRGVHPEHCALIEGLQPYKRPSGRDPIRQHPLGILSALSNRDKHQVLQVMAATQADAPWAYTFTGSFEERIACDLLPVDDFKAGAIVAWAQFSPPCLHPDVQMHWLLHYRIIREDPPTTDGARLRIQIEPELRFIVANVQAIIEGFAPIETGGEAQPVSFEIEALAARYRAHYYASPQYTGSDQIPAWTEESQITKVLWDRGGG